MVYFNDDGTEKIKPPPEWNYYRMDIYKTEKKYVNRVNQKIEMEQEAEIFLKYNLESACPNNITSSFVKNPNADNRFYYFRFIFKDRKYYKLGITSRTIQKRYARDYNKIDKILFDEKIDSAIKVERELKEKFKDHIFPLKIFNDSGHTEIYDFDILELDS